MGKWDDEGTVAELLPSESQRLAVRDGEQRDFVIRPAATRYYDIRTFGPRDSTMVLFEDDDGQLRYRTGHDDSGENRNAGLHVKLVQDHKYVLRTRLNYSDQASPPTVMMW